MLKSTKSQNYITWVLFAFVLALMPSYYLHHRINGFIVMLVIVIGVFQLISKPASIKEFAAIGLMPALFLTMLLGLIYSDDLTTGWTLIERSLSILLIPFAMFGSRNFTLKQQSGLMTLFVLSGFLASLYCLLIQGISAIEAGTVYTNDESTHFSFNTFMHHRLSTPLGMHAVYFSSFIALANLYLINRLFSLKKSIGRVIAIGVLILFFTVMLFLLKSAIISFAFAIAVMIIALVHLKKAQNKTFKYAFIVIIIAALTFGFFGVQTKLEHVNFNYDMTDPNMGMLAVRLSIWENALQVIQSNWVLGVGTGDADEALMKQYLQSKFEIGSSNDYNCHNMYLQYWLGNGLLGIGLFLAYFVLLFKKAIQHKNLVFIGFLIVFLFFSFTESTMRVQKGIVFFMVFSSIFYWSPTIWSNRKKTT